MEGVKIMDDIGRVMGETIIATGINQEKIDMDKEEEVFFSHVDGMQTFGKIIEKSCVEPYRGFEVLTNLVKEGLVKPLIKEEKEPVDTLDDFF
jgi:hypothetical protein